MWGYGGNYFGKLGSTELDSELRVPVCISDIETNPLYGIIINDISLATYHWDGCGLALDNTGKVYYFGYGVRDYFGYNGELEPICINTMENSPLNGVVISKISIGGLRNALFLDNTGKVWTFLTGNSWLSGTEETIDNGLPVCLSNIETNPLYGLTITEISAGYNNSLVIDSEGKIWSWGEYYGDNTDDSVNIPICLSNITTNPLYGIKAQKISAGAYHTLILDTRGKVWGYGENYRGELILEDEGIELPACLSDYENSEFYNKTITDISAGWDSTCLMDNENNYYLYGNFDVHFVS